MVKSLFPIIAALLLFAPSGAAKEQKDTLWTQDGDRLIITYDIKQQSDLTTLQITGVQKRLGYINSCRYRKLDEVVPVFFDRTGNYKGATFSNMIPDAFMLPNSVNYKESSNGYFFMNDNPVLSFGTIGNAETEISIPVYLAHYEKKHKYKLFASASNLKVRIKRSATTSAATTRQQQTTQAITTEIETAGDNELVTEALDHIHSIGLLLENQRQLPFSDYLLNEIIKLRELQLKITDKEVAKLITETLNNCELKKEELKTAEYNAAQQARATEEMQAQLAREQQARQDSIQAAASVQAEKEKKRNLFIIIGAAIVGVLLFIGNQIFQHFRNISNQKSMMEMQQSLTKQAENDAKRRANSYIRGQTNRAVNRTINNSKKAVRSKITGAGQNKNKGKFSI